MTTKARLHFLIVDDDQLIADIHKKILEESGGRATIINSGKEALAKVAELKPDCVLCDLMMPDMGGLELFQAIRKIENIKQPAFIIVTGKVYDFDRRESFEAGVDGYLTKPVNTETFYNDILEIINESMTIEFWGVRGTLPVPGKFTTYYGGNTNCVTMSFAKKNYFIFDAGTGIKALSNHLLKENIFPISAKIFISHPHYDHINGFPFFVPLYMKGNEFEICGASHGNVGIEKLISEQMECVYFPITTKEFAAKLSFRDLGEESFEIGNLQIQTMLLNHPGRCLGYRIQHKDKSFCYITDNEIYPENSPHYNQFDIDRLVKFIHGASLVVMDSTYTDKEYEHKAGWGHSSITQVVDLADKAKVQTLCLFHHDPDQFDKDIDAKLEHAKNMLKERNSATKCIAAREGDKILL